ncbi:hypothetical protein NGB36_29100 [Streptomyces sp. RB6PN25]|uniref:Uncharacterized protein n=1 Tax=Streptomyces humicola TaxID=2953240 RepID=A0ABT1Q3L6_9ACTN|nr:hypothetical protein [Streptomyces humicola]MCQ4084522.1 hypothetical protein [Streptomyces humicola]
MQGTQAVIVPSSAWSAGLALAVLLAFAALTAVPTRLGARRPVTQARHAESR